MTNPADRIAQLAQIDQELVKLLHCAGQAVESLTRSQPDGDSETSSSMGLDARKTKFTTATSHYFDTLATIDTSLRHQIIALEAADIIPAESSMSDSQTQSEKQPNLSVPTDGISPATQQSTSRRNQITGGGLGGLDVGWLNRRNDNVGKKTEAELWEEALHAAQHFEDQKRP